MGCMSRGFEENKLLSTVTFTPKKKRVRPAFERWEYRLLWRTLCKRINTAKDKRTRASRDCCGITCWCLPTQVFELVRQTS